MVDLSKHIARAKQGLERRNYDLVTETIDECVDVDPSQLDIHRIVIDCAKRRSKEGGGKGFSMSMPVFSRDPQKLLAGAVKRLGKGMDPKALIDAGDAALKMAQAGAKPMFDVAVLYYDEQRSGGLFNDKVLWNLANLWFEKYRSSKDGTHLDQAVKLLQELEKAMPQHPEAARTIKNWEAMRSMANRGGAAGGDYRSQLANDDKSRKAEVMNRNIRTVDDAREVLRFVDEDLKTNPQDKALWIKKGDIHRRIGELAVARTALDKAQAIDPHDFTVTMRLGDITLDELRKAVQDAEKAGGDVAAAKKALLVAEIDEYRRRSERQPTDMGHRYQLGIRLIQSADIDGAASEFQKTVSDPKLRKGSHRYLGYCFTKKNLLDLAQQQYTAYLALADDDQADEAKEVRYLRARSLEDQGKPAEAVKDYERLVAIDLSYKDAAVRLGKMRNP